MCEGVSTRMARRVRLTHRRSSSPRQSGWSVRKAGGTWRIGPVPSAHHPVPVCRHAPQAAATSRSRIALTGMAKTPFLRRPVRIPSGVPTCDFCDPARWTWSWSVRANIWGAAGLSPLSASQPVRVPRNLARNASGSHPPDTTAPMYFRDRKDFTDASENADGWGFAT